MSPQSIDRKEKRRKDLERKKEDARRRHQKMPGDLRSPRYRLRVEEEKKERGGSKNLTRDWDTEEN